MVLKMNCWHRDKIVAGTLWRSVVAIMNTTCGGGSSSILSSALNADVDSMWTSSMMKILYRLRAGAYLALSRSSRMLSTPVLDAASISKTSIDFPEEISSHDGQTLHGVTVGPFSQFRPFA